MELVSKLIIFKNFNNDEYLKEKKKDAVELWVRQL